jgi:hypothetical protein
VKSYLKYLQDLTERSKRGDALAALQLRQELCMPLRVHARMEARREPPRTAERDWLVSGAARDFCASATRGDDPSWRPTGACDTMLV